jgi:hypothetical protein
VWPYSVTPSRGGRDGENSRSPEALRISRQLSRDESRSEKGGFFIAKEEAGPRSLIVQAVRKTKAGPPTKKSRQVQAENENEKRQYNNNLLDGVYGTR